MKLAKNKQLFFYPFIFFLITVLLVAFLPPGSSASSSGTQSDVEKTRPKIDFVPGEILVRFREGRSATKAMAQKSQMIVRGATGDQIAMSVEEFDGSNLVDGLRLAHVRPEDTLSAIATLKGRSDVLYAEPNYVRRKDAVPNDPRFPEMWALKNTGQAGGTAGADIHAAAAWDTTTGSRSIVVGVVDEGIDVNHPDLKDNIWRNPGEIPGNGIDDDGDGFVDDVNGYDFVHNKGNVYDGGPGDNETDAHGTHVAGTIGAVGNNGTGVVGVNWQVQIMALKVLSAEGSKYSSTSVSATVRAYNYAKKMRDLYSSSGGSRGANIRVLNNSYGGGGYSQTEADAIRSLNESGILFVASAGNDSQDNDSFPHYPSSYNLPNVVSVAATNLNDQLSAFSNFGSLSVQIAAPGEGILSTTPNGSYSVFSGTSMAAPHVSGAAALICAIAPNLSAERLRSALIYSGDDLPGAKLLSGKRLNLAAALQNAVENDSTPPASISDFQIKSQNGRSVTLQWTAPGDDGSAGGSRASLYEIRYSDNDLNTSETFIAARPLPAPRPHAAGTLETVIVNVPYKHLAGHIGIRAIDNVGNISAISSVPVTVTLEASDPYVITEGGGGSITTGGTQIADLNGDDKTAYFSLPFAFSFFGQGYDRVTISTNGTLYFGQSVYAKLDDARGSIDRLQRIPMIAAMWDDLRTDRRNGDGVYVVSPDANRIVFRWQGVTYDTPLGGGVSRGENPVNFEIELRRDGTIQVRYGEGNTKLFPLVGISGGEPEASLVPSHSSPDNLINLTGAPSVTFTLRNPIVPPPPLPGGSGKIVFSSARDGQTHIYVMDPDGKNQIKLTDGPEMDHEPVLSPDGTKIAFTRGPGYNFQIYVMNSDGSNPVNITRNDTNNYNPTWSPDGKRIAFGKFTAGAGQDLYIMNSDGSNLINITNKPGLSRYCAWSPDGIKIAFSSDYPGNGIQSIYVINTDGTGLTRLTSARFTDLTPTWSPDGKKIAFAGMTDGLYDIFTMNADGSNQLRLTFEPSQEYNPTWSPDGTKIAFVSDRPSGYGIYTMNVDGTNQASISIPPSKGGDVDPNWGHFVASGAPAPAPLAAPVIMTRGETTRALALDSELMRPEPFSVENFSNLSPDGRTRVLFFARNIPISSTGGPVLVTVQAVTSQNITYTLPVEAEVFVPGYDWLTGVVVRLPDMLIGAGDIEVSISVSGKVSNKALINITQ